jgi:hypothetical protein
VLLEASKRRNSARWALALRSICAKATLSGCASLTSTWTVSI